MRTITIFLILTTNLFLFSCVENQNAPMPTNDTKKSLVNYFIESKCTRSASSEMTSSNLDSISNYEQNNFGSLQDKNWDASAEYAFSREFSTITRQIRDIF